METVIFLLIIGAAWVAYRLVRTEQERREFRDAMGIEPDEITEWLTGRREHLSNPVTEQIIREQGGVPPIVALREFLRSEGHSDEEIEEIIRRRNQS